MDRGAWGTAVFGVARSRTQLGVTNSFTVIKREKFDSVELRWMNLEPVIQKEVRQEEKYCILMCIYIYIYIYIYMKSRKIVLMKLQGRNRDPDVGNGLVDISEEGDGGTH